MRRLLGLAAAVGAVLAAISFVRRGTVRKRERVDLYFDDGSMVSLGESSAQAARLLSLARDGLRFARAGE